MRFCRPCSTRGRMPRPTPERFWGGPLPVGDWRRTLQRVFDYLVRTEWQRGERCHV